MPENIGKLNNERNCYLQNSFTDNFGWKQMKIILFDTPFYFLFDKNNSFVQLLGRQFLFK